MKNLALFSVALGVALVALPVGTASDSGDGDGIELACKPRGTKCHSSFECCSQKCQEVNGVEACH